MATVIEQLPDEVEGVGLVEEADPAPLSATDKLARMAQASGDISDLFDAEYITRIGARVVSDYERDKADRKEWEDVARDALAACSQEEQTKAKDTPWPNAANMRYPLLTTAALQFNARMYPAVVKGDEAILCKVIGNDTGVPVMAPNPRSGEIQPVPAMEQGPDGQPQVKQPAEPQWQVPPGAKAKRALRVSTYLNYLLFYRMDNWEADTDQLLIQLPAVGCMFRKIWTDSAEGPRTATVSALRLIVPINTRDIKQALRITEEIPDQYPHEIKEKQLSGFYRNVDLGLPNSSPQGTAQADENDGARLLLEQHCRWDFDGDGLAEPYLVTVDHETQLVLRIEPNFGPDDITWTQDTEGRAFPARIAAQQFYVKFGMFPHPDGKFYDIGLGHLLKRLGDVIDTAINQLLDAGTAQTAGGGFIGSGVRLQTRGGRGSLRLAPGEYKTVDVAGDALRNNIVERTLPNVSPVTFQVLELILGAAKDIAGAKDVITGDASNTGQVGTTLALIEQGLQVFNATAKRIFRALRQEYTLLNDNVATHGPLVGLPADYQNVLDDPAADFKADFELGGLNIAPISDPSNVTRIQKMAKAQFKLQLLPQIQAVGGDAREVIRRVLEAVDEEDIEKILPPPPPQDPQQMQMQMAMAALQLRTLAAKAGKDEASAHNLIAQAMENAAQAAHLRFDLGEKATRHGMDLGATAASVMNGAGQ